MKKFVWAASLPLAYLLFCAAVAAILAYPVYEITGEAIGFRNLVSRGGLILLVLGLYPLARRLGLKAADLGLESRLPVLLRQTLLGLGLGILMLTLHSLALIALQARIVDPGAFRDCGRLLEIAAKGLGIGIAVAAIEETIFRGVLFTVARRISGRAAAIVISAFYYAALHFLRSRRNPEESEISWNTGFHIVADAFAYLAQMPFDSFLALLLGGALLGCVRAAFPRGLAYCIGLHAGWVFVIKFGKALTNGVPDGPRSFLVGSYDGFIGYLAAAWISILVLTFVFLFRRNFGRQAAS